MLRTTDLILVALMVAAATLTYQVKHQAEAKLAEVERLKAEIELQEDTIDLLEADWSLLNQPARLQMLTERYAETLELETTRPEQIATFQELPRRAQDERQTVDDLIAGATDPIRTGSLAR